MHLSLVENIMFVLVSLLSIFFSLLLLSFGEKTPQLLKIEYQFHNLKVPATISCFNCLPFLQPCSN